MPLVRDRLVLVPHERKLGAVRCAEVLHAVAFVVLADGGDLETDVGVLHAQLFELGERLLAGLAPRRPEVHEDDLPLPLRERDLPLTVHAVGR